MEPREPQPGEIQIVVLLGTTSFIAWAPSAQAEALMDAFESRAGLDPSERTSRTTHAQVRVEIARLLRTPEAEAHFTRILAAGSLWLALRHWSGAAEMRQGLQRQMDETGFAVVTASIPDEPPAGMMPDTAWAFMVGSRIHDGRPRLSQAVPGEVAILMRD